MRSPSVAVRQTQRTRQVSVRAAGPGHQVVTLVTPREREGRGRRRWHRVEPCGGCPWRVDQVGSFPAESFRLSARTAYDLSEVAFACHESGSVNPATCAGFLLRGATHNLAVRLALIRGDVELDQVSDGGHLLHQSYRAMAMANGVAVDDPALVLCRDSS